jgi:hypothetical protein
MAYEQPAINVHLGKSSARDRKGRETPRKRLDVPRKHVTGASPRRKTNGAER